MRTRPDVGAETSSRLGKARRISHSRGFRGLHRKERLLLRRLARLRWLAVAAQEARAQRDQGDAYREDGADGDRPRGPEKEA